MCGCGGCSRAGIFPQEIIHRDEEGLVALFVLLGCLANVLGQRRHNYDVDQCHGGSGDEKDRYHQRTIPDSPVIAL